MKRLLCVLAALALTACAMPGTDNRAGNPAAYTPTGKIEMLWLGQSAFRVAGGGTKVIGMQPGEAVKF